MNLIFDEGGVFSATPVWSSGPINATLNVSLGDVDGDGDLDLVCGNDGSNTLYRNQRSMFSAAPVWLSGPVNQTWDMSLGDVDGDGDLDLVCGNGGSNTIYLNEDGVFSVTSAWSGPANLTESVSLGDVDGDGNLDLVCGKFLPCTTLFWSQGSMFSAAPVWLSGPVNETWSVSQMAGC